MLENYYLSGFLKFNVILYVAKKTQNTMTELSAFLDPSSRIFLFPCLHATQSPPNRMIVSGPVRNMFQTKENPENWCGIAISTSKVFTYSVHGGSRSLLPRQWICNVDANCFALAVKNCLVPFILSFPSSLMTRDSAIRSILFPFRI